MQTPESAQPHRQPPDLAMVLRFQVGSFCQILQQQMPVADRHRLAGGRYDGIRLDAHRLTVLLHLEQVGQPHPQLLGRNRIKICVPGPGLACRGTESEAPNVVACIPLLIGLEKRSQKTVILAAGLQPLHDRKHRRSNTGAGSNDGRLIPRHQPRGGILRGLRVIVKLLRIHDGLAISPRFPCRTGLLCFHRQSRIETHHRPAAQKHLRLLQLVPLFPGIQRQMTQLLLDDIRSG